MHLLQLQSLAHRLRAWQRVLLPILLILTLAVPAAADKAKSLYNKGRDAEARQNWEQAYDFYKQAYELKPKELRYRTSYERARFQAASAHVHRGFLLRENGNLEAALAEFQRALQIDPALDVARQEIRRTQQMIEKAGAPKPQAVAPPPSTELGRMVAEAQGPAELKPISSAPITLKMTEDSKVIYTTIGKLAGINVLFDPDYVSRRISVELNNVSLYQALEIVALESKTFWRAVTPNTIFAAADTKAKRTELEQSVVKTFYLANLSQPTELQDVVNTLRTVVEITRVLSLPSQGAIIVRGTPDQVALAQKLIGDIDKARPEVVVDVVVMQVSLDKLRTLGIQPPTSASVQLQGNVQTSTTPSTTPGTTTGTTTTTSSTPGQVTLNKLANLTSNDFVVTIPSATASFLANDSTTKIIQQPQIRALDGQKATLKIGDRVPVATGSFQPGIGGVGINPLVNTQFQYIDVGVNIDVTPTVHVDREVTLKVTMEVSSVTSHVNIGGIDQPVIGQRRVEHTIRLKEGEVNLMGGMLEQQDTKSLTGFPWISQVPILKYLFSQTSTEHKENEIVFALVPHIVRVQNLTALNERALDVGTASAIELRRVPSGNNGSATAPIAHPSQAAPLPPATPPQQPSTPPAATAPVPGQAAAPSQPATSSSQPAGSAILSFDPAQISQPVGSTFMVNVAVSGATNVYSVPVQVSFDPKMLQLLNVSNGNFLSRDGQPVVVVHREDAPGLEQISASRPPGSGGVSGQGTVFTLTFLAKGGGQSTLNITRAGARDAAMQPLQVTAGQAMVTIK